MQHNVSLPAWSDAPELVKDGVLHVSIHAPAWGATVGDHQLICKRSVSIHAPAWGATSSGLMTSESRSVSIHAPAWGATRTGPQADYTGLCFNPRSRVGSDIDVVHGNLRQGVSIHAPAWGATAGFRRVAYDSLVSIHAPAWGATSICARSPASSGFQSTLPRGERPPRD